MCELERLGSVLQREDNWSEVTDFVEFFFGIELPALNFLDDGAVLLVGYLFDGLDYRPGPLIRNNEVGGREIHGHVLVWLFRGSWFSRSAR